MALQRRLAALGAVACGAALGAAPAQSRPARGDRNRAPVRSAAAKPVNPHALEHSHLLWATINICDPPGRADTVGIRGSMPGDGRGHDRMYMSFRLQYEVTATKQWLDLANAASAGWMAVGAGGSARQGGVSFTLKPMAGKPAVTLRGVVDFQWRAGKTVEHGSTRTTTARHKSVTGADPPGYSAASCSIG